MPINQIAVAPVNGGKSTPRSKDKREGKGSGRSRSRSSNVSKVSSSTTPVTPSCQDICSSDQLAGLKEDASEGTAHSKLAGLEEDASEGTAHSKLAGLEEDVSEGTAHSKLAGLEEDASEGTAHSKLAGLEEDASEGTAHSKLAGLEEDASEGTAHSTTAVMAIDSTTLGSSAQSQKKQVKRRHRRKRESDCDTNSKQDPTDRSDRSPSSDRSERGEMRERSSRTRGEVPPRTRSSVPPHSNSSSEGEGRREARSWSKEKAKRGRCHRGSSRDVGDDSQGKGGDDNGEAMELQSMGSDEGKEDQARPESKGSLKKRSRGSGKREGRGPQKDEEQKSQGDKSPRPAEEGEELITKSYQEKGSGGGDMSVPTPKRHCGVNGGMVRPCSEDSELEVCRICHCEGDEEFVLITPCRCTGSLTFVHQSCLNQWIKSSDTRCCELCKFDFIMEAHLKPLRKWERLQMSQGERRKIFGSVFFHLIAIACVLWSVFLLVTRTLEEIRIGRTDDFWRVSTVRYYTSTHGMGVLEWPFWTKLIVVAISFTGMLIFMYVQCKDYLQLWRRLKSFNRIITVQNCPDKAPPSPRAPPATMANGKHGIVVVPINSAPVPVAQTDSDHSVEAAVAPV